MSIRRDRFKTEIQSRLKDFSVQKDTDGWASIESQILRRKKIVLLRQIYSVAAVILLFLVLGIRFYTPNKKIDNHIQLSQTNTPVIEFRSQPVEGVSVDMNRKFAKLNVDGSRFENFNKTEIEQNIVEEQLPSKQKVVVVAAEPKEVKPKSIEGSTVSEVPQEEVYSDFWNEPEPVVRKSYSPQMSIGLSSSGAVSVNGNVVNRGRMALFSAPTIANSIDYADAEPQSNKLIPKVMTDFRDYHCTYNTPISLGLSLNIGLPKNFSIKTGVQATMYSTEYRFDDAEDKVAAKVDMWYLGIPVNASWSFFKSRFFDSYLSLGALAEKSVSLKHTGEDIVFLDHSDNLLSDVAVKDIPFQFSANASLGLQFNIVDLLSIYFEPGVSYSFENQSPISNIRTQSPFTFNMTAGLRFNL